MIRPMTPGTSLVLSMLLVGCDSKSTVPVPESSRQSKANGLALAHRAQSLPRQDQRPNAKVLELLHVLEDKAAKSTAREEAASALMAIDPNGREGVTALCAVAEDEGEPTLLRVRVITALARSEGSRAKPALRRIAQNQQSFILRFKAREALARLAPHDEEAAKQLVESARKHAGREVRVSDGPRTVSWNPRHDVVTVLIETRRFDQANAMLTEDLVGDAETQAVAATRLAALGPIAKPALPALVSLLDSRGTARDEATVMMCVMQAAIAIDPTSDEVARALAGVSRDHPDSGVRQIAAQLLHKTRSKR